MSFALTSWSRTAPREAASAVWASLERVVEKVAVAGELD